MIGIVSCPPVASREPVLLCSLYYFVIRKGTDCAPPGPPARARQRPCSARGRDCRRLHHVLHHVFADLAAHILADARRKSVMEAGPDAGVRHFFVIGPYIGPPMGGARRGRTG